MQNPFSDSFGFKNPIFDFLKEMHSKIPYQRCTTHSSNNKHMSGISITKVIFVYNPCLISISDSVSDKRAKLSVLTALKVHSTD